MAPLKAAPHVALDARFLTHPQAGGFRTYTRELCSALARADTSYRFTLYVDREPFPDNDIPHGDNVTVTVVPGRAPFVGMPLREQRGLVRAVERDRPDLLHSLCNTAPAALPCPLVVTLHDTLWNAPAVGSSLSQRVLHSYTRLAARRAAQKAVAVCVPSKHVCKCVTQELGVDTRRVFVTPEGAGRAFKPSPPHLISSFALPESDGSARCLALGSADPRKNLPMLARAWAGLPDTLKATHTLTTVWADREASQDFERLCKRLNISQSVVVLSAVTEKKLADLYRQAAVFLFPSQAEGFGLPTLEAMQCGCPVIASDATSMPEVCGDAALLLDPSDVPGWTAALADVLTGETLREDLRARGKIRAAMFSWDECARRTLAAYEFACRKP